VNDFKVVTKDLRTTGASLHYLSGVLGDSPVFKGVDIEEAAGDPTLIAAFAAFHSSVKREVSQVASDVSDLAQTLNNAGQFYSGTDQGVQGDFAL
jgi:hypothetical protein